MKQQWEERFAEKEYVYGKIPNLFLKSFIDKHKPGKILFPAEGEGRNAVYAASKKWEVIAFDQSKNAQNKAMKLASESNVTYEYLIKDILDADFAPSSFDYVALIYCHLPTIIREDFYKRAITWLKPNGYIVLEGFSKKHFPSTSMGPKDIDLLFDIPTLEKNFHLFNFIVLREEETFLDEGKLHQGKAEVVRMIARKQ